VQTGPFCDTLMSPQPLCSERQFVVSYFMADDSISVFEHPTDGFPGGKFLERGQVPRNRHLPGDIITDKDLFIGAHLLLYRHAFIIERQVQLLVSLPGASPDAQCRIAQKRRRSICMQLCNSHHLHETPRDLYLAWD